MSTVEVKNKTTGQIIKLTDNNFLASGGEANIFVVDDTVYKIYHKSERCIPEAKVTELATIDGPHILIPKDMLVHPRNTNTLGTTLDFAKNTISLVKLTIPKYKKKNGIAIYSIVLLLKRIQDLIQFIHKNGCLIVDGNEMNYRVSEKDITLPYMLDTDSYATPNFPATAWHPATKDYSTKEFTTLTDWFSFSIVAFRLLVGIHPFKGTHPNYQKDDLQGRMTNNISIFDSSVKLPPSVGQLNQLPSNYLDWFKLLYVQGGRAAPPGVAGELKILTTNIIVQTDSGRVKIKLHSTYEGDITNVYTFPFHEVIVTTQHKYVNGKIADQYEAGSLISSLPDNNSIIIKSYIHNGILGIMSPYQTKYGVIHCCKDQFIVDEFLFVVTQNALNYVKLTSSNKRVFAGIEKSWKFLPNSTQVLTGCLYSSILGNPHLFIPYFSQKHKAVACSIIPIPEIQNKTVIDGKRDLTVVMLAVYDGTKYQKIILKFNEEFTQYSCFPINTDNPSALNFVVLDTNIVVHITDDDVLEAFPSAPRKTKVTEIHDKQIKVTMTLFKLHNKVVFAENNELKHLTLSKS